MGDCNVSKLDTPEKKERHRLRELARRNANREEYNRQAMLRRIAKGILPRPSKMPREEILRRGRERENKKNRLKGMKERVKLTPEQRMFLSRKRVLEWHASHPLRVREIQEKHRPKRLIHQREYNKTPNAVASRKRWKEKHPEVLRAGWQRRTAREKSLLHPAHDYAKETIICAEAVRLTNETGIRHDVDHIIPLAKGGWHHHDNLQVLPHSINKAKLANPFWEQAPYKSWRYVPEELWPDGLADEYNALKYGIAV